MTHILSRHGTNRRNLGNTRCGCDKCLCVMPAGYGVGDHRLFMVDFLTSSLVGLSPTKIIRAEARLLNTKIHRTAKKYSEEVERLTLTHRVIEEVGLPHEVSSTKEEAKRKFNKIDEEVKQQLKGAEKRCRKIKSFRIPFPPELLRWIRRAQMYRLIFHYHADKIQNRGNLKRAAPQCGLSKPLEKTLLENCAGLKECKKRCNYFGKHGHRHHQRHLKYYLKKARDSGYRDVEK